MKDFFDNRLKQNLFLIFAGILFAAVLINIDMVAGGIGKFIGLFTPLIVGGAIAFVLNVPMSFFEKKLTRLSARRKAAKTAEMKVTEAKTVKAKTAEMKVTEAKTVKAKTAEIKVTEAKAVKAKTAEVKAAAEAAETVGVVKAEALADGDEKPENTELFAITDHESHMHEVLDELEEELEKGRSRRITVISLLLTLAIIVMLIFVLVAVIVPNLADSVKSIISYISKMYPTWVEMLSSHGISPDLINEYASKLDLTSFLSKLSDTSGDFVSLISSKIGTVFGAAANMLVGIVFAIYILLDKKNIGRKTKKLVYSYFKPKLADELYEIARLSYRTFAKFLSGQGLEAVILGTIFCVVLTIGRFPNAVSIATIIGMLSLIPIVGAFIGMAFGVLLISVVSFRKALIFIVVFVIVQQIEGNLIYPKVVGGSVGLPAIWTLLAVLIGGNVAGIIGCICFIPLFSIIYVLLERDINKRFKRKRELKKQAAGR